MTSTPSPLPTFLTQTDLTNSPYFTFNPLSVPSKTLPTYPSATPSNLCTFLSESINITRRATGPFSTDLTPRDDLLLAVLSLLLLLLVEASLTTLLLRSRAGALSSFAFSVKHFFDLARDFNFRYLVRGRRPLPHRSATPGRARTHRNVNYKLLIVATAVLLFIFALEVVILYLSTPQLRNVTNTTTSFQLTNTMPEWDQVKKNTRAATIRPCTAITFSGVEQGRSQISACLTAGADGLQDSVDGFEKVTSSVPMSIVSVIHEYGEEHTVTIDGLSANFSARAYFMLEDGKSRLMRRRLKFFNKEKSIGVMHKQLIALLFSAYAQETGDSSLGIDVLNSLKIKLKSIAGDVINIISIKGTDRYRQVTSVKHTSTVEGRIPGGLAALQFAQAVLKGSIAINLVGPDRYDLIMGSSNTFGKEALMWRESARALNWLSLTILLGIAAVFYAVLRCIFSPISTVEIAGAYVIGVVGAEKERPPLFLDGDEHDTFSLSFLTGMGEQYEKASSGFTLSVDRTDESAELQKDRTGAT